MNLGRKLNQRNYCATLEAHLNQGKTLNAPLPFITC